MSLHLALEEAHAAALEPDLALVFPGIPEECTHNFLPAGSLDGC